MAPRIDSIDATRHRRHVGSWHEPDQPGRSDEVRCGVRPKMDREKIGEQLKRGQATAASDRIAVATQDFPMLIRVISEF
jgi:hypothetical protein